MTHKIVKASDLFDPKKNPNLNLTAEFAMKNLPSAKITCSICGMQFNADDDDLENRKQIHENFHKPRLVKSNKVAGLKTNVNTTVGKVVWKND